jgi:polyphosphate glucokinase
MKILVLDVGGSNVKIQAAGNRQRLKFPSGPEMTPARMVATVKKLVAGWDFEAVSIGYPGPVVSHRIVREPHNLAAGWVGFDFKKAFGRPVKIVNDAAMQALGSYRGKRMIFLGLGTGLGSAMVVGGQIIPMELAHLPYRKGRTYEEYLGAKGLERMGKKKWITHVFEVVGLFQAAFVVDYMVLGGGNARFLETLPPNTFLGNNANAIRGGFRLWTEPKSPGKSQGAV